MQEILIDIHIAPEEYLKCYRVAGAVVHATSCDGRAVQFPAAILQRFVTRDGVSGVFRIVCSDEGKYQRIDRLR